MVIYEKISHPFERSHGTTICERLKQKRIILKSLVDLTIASVVAVLSRLQSPEGAPQNMMVCVNDSLVDPWAAKIELQTHSPEGTPHNFLKQPLKPFRCVEDIVMVKRIWAPSSYTKSGEKFPSLVRTSPLRQHQTN